MTERLPSFDPSQAPEIDTSVAHSARVWNYLLGGKENFAADREAAKQVMQFVPNFAEDARADRGFLIRAVRYLTGEAGIRQFLDIGTGLPPPTTPTRSPKRSHRSAASSTSTTTH